MTAAPNTIPPMPHQYTRRMTSICTVERPQWIQPTQPAHPFVHTSRPVGICHERKKTFEHRYSGHSNDPQHHITHATPIHQKNGLHMHSGMLKTNKTHPTSPPLAGPHVPHHGSSDVRHERKNHSTTTIQVTAAAPNIILSMKTNES